MFANAAEEDAFNRCLLLGGTIEYVLRNVELQGLEASTHMAVLLAATSHLADVAWSDYCGGADMLYAIEITLHGTQEETADGSTVH